MSTPIDISAHRPGLELCGRCGHRLDHVAKVCQHPVRLRQSIPPEEKAALGTTDDFRLIEQICGCPNGVRTDVLQCRQNSEIIQQNATMIDALTDIFKLMLVISDFEVAEDGTLRPRNNGGVITL